MYYISMFLLWPILVLEHVVLNEGEKHAIMFGRI